MFMRLTDAFIQSNLKLNQELAYMSNLLLINWF